LREYSLSFQSTHVLTNIRTVLVGAGCTLVP